MEVHRVVAEQVVRREIRAASEPQRVALGRGSGSSRASSGPSASAGATPGRCRTRGTRGRRPGMWSASSAGSSPSTLDQFTPAFSNSAPSSRTRATPPPPPGRCHASAAKPVPPSALRGPGRCRSVAPGRTSRAIEQVRHDPHATIDGVARPMWAAIRLLRATRVFGDHLPQLHVADVVGAAVAESRSTRARAGRRSTGATRAGCTGASSACAACTSSSARSSRSWGRSCRASTPRSSKALQDDVPPQSYKKIKTTFVKSFGKQPHQVFATFDEEPIAAASLGQVHEATQRRWRAARGQDPLSERRDDHQRRPPRARLGAARLQELRPAAADRARARAARGHARARDRPRERGALHHADGEELRGRPRRAVPDGVSRAVERQDRDDDDVHGRREDHEEGRARASSSSTRTRSRRS